MPLTNRPTRLEKFEEDNGLKPHTMHDWQLAREKAAADPASLTEREILIIEFFDSAKAADAARHAAKPAPVVPATKASSLADAPVSLAVSTALILEATKSDPDPAFDRVKFAAAVRAERAELAPIVPGAYDPIAFTVAHAQFKHHPAGLTDADIAQLKLVDDDLGNEAMAARAGYVEAKSDEEKQSADLSHMPVSARGLIAYVGHLKDGLSLWVSTVQRLARETKLRVDALEQRLVDPKDASTALSQAVVQIEGLTDRVSHLEARTTLEYQGVFESGKSYKRGDAVTFKGSVWIALSPTSAAPTFGATIGPRPWQLAVRAGQDGKDLR